MNQPCQRFSGGPQSSRTPSTTLVHVVFLLDPGLIRGYERALTSRQQVTRGCPGLPGGPGHGDRAAAPQSSPPAAPDDLPANSAGLLPPARWSRFR